MTYHVFEPLHQSLRERPSCAETVHASASASSAPKGPNTRSKPEPRQKTQSVQTELPLLGASNVVNDATSLTHCPDCLVSMHEKHGRTYALHASECSHLATKLCSPPAENPAVVPGASGAPNGGPGVCARQRYMVTHTIHDFPNVITVKAKTPTAARYLALLRLKKMSAKYGALAVFVSAELESVALDKYMAKFA